MVLMRAAIAAGTALCASPATASDYVLGFSGYEAPASRGQPITAIRVDQHEFEVLAVTRKGRADTPLRRAHLDECRSMEKVLPGYPQPAFISVDLRVRF
ncbi:MAG: hypothetical protein AAGC77_11890 [Pseudomonadota bacterium]